MNLFYGRWYTPFHTIGFAITCIILFYAPSNYSHNIALPLPLTTQTLWWKVFTSNVVHISSYHLWNNCLPFLVLGGLFEAIHGPILSASVVWIGGTTGIFMEAAWYEKEKEIILLGASGCVYAVIGAYLGHLAVNFKETPFRVPFAICIVVWLVLSITYTYVSEDVTKIAIIAHIGGAVQGVLVGCVAVRNIRIRPREDVIRVVSFILSAGLIFSVTCKAAILPSAS